MSWASIPLKTSASERGDFVTPRPLYLLWVFTRHLAWEQEVKKGVDIQTGAEQKPAAPPPSPPSPPWPSGEDIGSACGGQRGTGVAKCGWHMPADTAIARPAAGHRRAQQPPAGPVPAVCSLPDGKLTFSSCRDIREQQG